MSKILYGSKVVLFPAVDKDLADFIRLHREDKDGLLGDLSMRNMTDQQAKDYIVGMILSKQLLIWTGYTKQGKGSRLIGFVYLTNFNNDITQISGIMDNKFANGLLKEIRRNKYTYSEDTLRTMLNFLFTEMNVKRVEAYTLEDNRLPQRLIDKIGFVKEGKLRNAYFIDDKPFNVLVFSLLKGEYKNAQTESKTTESESVPAAGISANVSDPQPVTDSINRGNEQILRSDGSVPTEHSESISRDSHASVFKRNVLKRTRRTVNRKRTRISKPRKPSVSASVPAGV